MPWGSETHMQLSSSGHKTAEEALAAVMARVRQYDADAALSEVEIRRTSIVGNSFDVRAVFELSKGDQ